MDAEYRAEDHHQHNLNAGEQVRRAPEPAEYPGHLHPKGGVVVVLLLELINFRAFQTECPNHPHAGEVLLGHSREFALVFVAFLPALVDALVEVHRIENDQRHRDQRQQSQFHVHRQHKGNRQHQHNHNAENGGQLLRKEVFHRIDVRGAALDDVAGAVFHVPREGQVLDVTEETVTHGLDQSFRGAGVTHPEAKLGHHLEGSDYNHRQGQNPQILPQIRKTAEFLHQRHHEAGEIRFFAADGVVHSRTDDLGIEHIRQGCYCGGQNCQQEIPFGTLQEIPKQFRFRFLFIFHNVLPLNNGPRSPCVKGAVTALR